MSATYQAYRAKGLCGDCGNLPTDAARCLECRNKHNARGALFRDNRAAAGLCRRCGEPARDGSTHCQGCLDKGTNLRKTLRLKVFAAYGNECRCCGEVRYEFLSIDHVNGAGQAHRKRREHGGQGETFYRHLLNAKPEDIQLLCHNCNQAKGWYGKCPHEMD